MAIVLGENKMKYCPKCKVEKGLSEFSKSRSRRDGLQRVCKECCRKYQKEYKQTEAGKETRRKALRKYQQTERGKEAFRKAYRKYGRKRRLLYPEKSKAVQAVNDAIAAGKLTRPSICESCFNERFTEGHHEDYSKPLDVDWLCKKCHREIDKREVLV